MSDQFEYAGGNYYERVKVYVGAEGTIQEVSASSPMPTTSVAGATGGATPYSLISAATTNTTSVKASAGALHGLLVTNINASPRYLKLYDKASAPNLASDTPVARILIPGNTLGGGVQRSFPAGIQFSSGIAFAVTTGVADTDTGAVAASEILVNLEYK